MRNIISVIVYSFVVLSSSGCASPKLYPICFYKDKPDNVTLDTVFIPRLKQSFSAVTNQAHEKITISPDARWMIVSTTDAQNKKLLEMWPRIGCIGPAGSASEVKLQIDCIDYVQSFIQERKYTELGAYTYQNITYPNESRDANRLVYCSKHI